MRKSFLNFFVFLFLAVTLVSCHRDVKIIPKAKMSKIFAEMFIADGWLSQSTYTMRNKADSMAFYEPIFNAHGYTTEDYIASTSHYLEDPERFARIVKKSRLIILQEMKNIQDEADTVITREKSPVRKSEVVENESREGESL